jgi:nucleotide-binding universal stress UspA family protein
MKLLVVVDLSEATEKIVKKAEEIAKVLSAKVWLLHVAEPQSDFVGLDVDPQVGLNADLQSVRVRDALAKGFHSEHFQIQKIADRLRKAGLETTALLMQGATVETILKEASKLDVDMIVVGSHGRGAMYQFLVGSVSEGVLHRSECPILVIPTHERT